MILIAESINIMSKTIGPAMRERNPKPIQELAIKQVECGADILDLNVGPARKGGEEMIEWLVKIVEEVVDVPLSLDTTNPITMEAGLKAVKKHTPLLNSVSAQKERLEQTLPLAKKYNVPFVALLLSDAGIPRNVEERVSVFFDILTASQALDIPTDNLWVDPIIFTVSGDQSQLVNYVEFLKILPDLAGQPIKTTCGLSNAAQGSPLELKSLLVKTLLAILMETGNQTSAIVDTLDTELVSTARVMESSNLEQWLASLPEKEQINVRKTMKILKNEVLYCHSWLEL